MLYYQDDKRYINQFSKTTFKTTRLGPYSKDMLPAIKNNDGSERNINSIPRTLEESVYYQYPKLQDEFVEFTDPKYKNLTLKDVGKNCNFEAKWQCNKCHNHWITYVTHRTKQEQACPFCNKQSISFPEKYIYYCLSQVDPNLQENYRISNSQTLEFDMYDPASRLAIEFSSGRYHSDKQDSDEQKLQYALSQNIRLIRIWQLPSEKQVSKLNDDAYVIPAKRSINGVSDLNIVIDNICKRYNFKYSLIDQQLALNQAFIRTNKTPPAGESLLDKFPDICRDWDYTKNGVVKPQMLYSSSGIKVHWKCLYCHKEWVVQPNQRTAADKSYRAGCKTCNMKIGRGILQEIPYIPDK